MITLSNVHLIAAAKNIESCGMFDKYLKEQISLDRILISSISNIRKLKHDLGMTSHLKIITYPWL